jgi:hypothetical protein
MESGAELRKLHYPACGATLVDQLGDSIYHHTTSQSLIASTTGQDKLSTSIYALIGNGI